jgi:N-acetylneuraminate synthase
MNNNRFDFKNLFVLDIANNHQGSMEHGKNIIEYCKKITQDLEVKVAIKFQFRDLDTFIYKKYKGSNKHISRFTSTKLPWNSYKKLVDIAKSLDLITICTPFDENSVDKIVEMKFDVIKIASCSANDWPLLRKAASTGFPMIVSTGGLTLIQIDDVVSFLEHRGVNFALMHCVSVYPTPDSLCNLANITTLKSRYPNLVIGWSTHEDPSDTIPIGIATALGAEMFEKHVGISSSTIKLNAYSASPEQIENWIIAYKKTITLMGSVERQNNLIEQEEIVKLKRGVFTKTSIKAGESLTLDKIYFAFPYYPGCLTSGDWNPDMLVKEHITIDTPIAISNINTELENSDSKILKDAIHEVKSLLNKAKVTLTTEFTTEYSHHYGIKNFLKTGAILINVINRLYSKKIIVQLPGQNHPKHFHKKKEETFLVLSGILHVDIENRTKILHPGDTLLVLPGVWHSFWTTTGCVFEEISTTNFINDSVYQDNSINNNTNRKTIVDHWGRFQI